MKITIICKQCGKPFLVQPSRVKEGRKFCSRSCYISAPQPRELVERRRKSNLGVKHNFKGFCFDGQYKLIFKPNHPRSSKAGYVYEYRLVAEKALGRYLELTEVLHHINFNPLDNSLSNLFVFENQSEHLRYHQSCINNPFLKTWLISNLNFCKSH